MTATVIYGTESGTTALVARRIAARLTARLVDVAQAQRDDFESCDLLVLGAPTYGFGDLPTDWEKALGLLRAAGLAGKPVALFGTGDQRTYPDTFVDAIGLLYDEVVARGARVVGFTEIAGYDFTASRAVRDGRFVGLALDEDGQASQTGERIAGWVGELV
jgi:flavodoxin I